jgi:outer membrane scaffolding protein for murein synthesis (MipA/OmpV family)
MAIVAPLLALGVLHVIVPEFVAYLIVLGVVVFLYPKYSQPSKNTTIAVPVPVSR